MAGKNGGPAFPVMWDYADNETGMTLRDWFAGQAMQGILAGPCSRDGTPLKEWFDVPAHAYQLADAMLAARQTE
jgi:hypothetical protein